ncbi:MAG: RNA polymerase sigma factor [Nannocystales bacterium]
MSTDNHQDSGAFDAWARGDQAAGAEFVGVYFDLVFRFFDRKVRTGAEDLTQQTFLECLAAHSRYRGDGPLRAFILGVARRQLGKHLRKSIRGRQALDTLKVSVNELFAGPSTAAAMRDVEGALGEAMRNLPVELQTLVELRYWEGLPLAEIGRVVQAPVGTVKSRLSRARALLRESIESAGVGSQLRRSVLERLEGWHD